MSYAPRPRRSSCSSCAGRPDPSPPFCHNDSPGGDADVPALKEAEGKLAAKQAELKGIFDEAGPELDMSKVKSVAGGDRQAVLEHIRALNAELDELGAKAGELREIRAAADRAARIPGQRESGDGSDTKGAGDKHERELKSIGELFTASDAFKLKQRGQTSGPVSSVDVELKTLMTTSAGWAPEVTGRAGSPSTPTGRSDPRPDPADHHGSGGGAVHGGPPLHERCGRGRGGWHLRRVGARADRDDQQCAEDRDVPAGHRRAARGRAAGRGLINNRLPLFVRLRLDGQVVNGNGTAPNLRGFLNVVGIQTQARPPTPPRTPSTRR